MKHQFKLLKGTFATLFAALFTLFLCSCDDPIEIHVPESFMVAFANQSSEVKVRYSQDGLIWKNGNFPNGNYGTSFNGIGAITDEYGVLNIIAVDASNSVKLTWGFGPEIWDQSANAEVTEPIISAPSGTKYEQSKWLIAYNTNGRVAEAKVYDSGERSFILKLDLDDPLNTNVDGRPALISKNGKFIIAWRSFSNGLSKLIVANGHLNSGIPVFNKPFKEIPLVSNNDYKAGLTSDPDLTYDNEYFYLAFVREEAGGEAGTLHGWDALLYRSTNGTDWEFYKNIPGLIVTGYKTYLNIAAKSRDTLMVAAVRDTEVASASLLIGNDWTILDESKILDMFGSTKINPKQFALIKFGEK